MISTKFDQRISDMIAVTNIFFFQIRFPYSLTKRSHYSQWASRQCSVECNGSGVELRIFDNENPSSNPELPLLKL